MKQVKRFKKRKAPLDKPSKKRKLIKKPEVIDEVEENQHEDESDEELPTELTGQLEDDLNLPQASDDDEKDSTNYEHEIEDHKQSLNKLKETDPEFYAFLQDNDQQLLQFAVSDSEDDDEEAVHKLPDKLDVASDESDFENDDEDETTRKATGQHKKITLKLLKKWQTDLRTDKSVETIRDVIGAFHAAMVRVSGDEDDVAAGSFRVEGSSIFNAVIQVCMLDLSPAIRRFLGLKSGAQGAAKVPPHKCKKFGKIKTLLRGYFNDLLKLMKGVTSTNILRVLLKHLHHMSVLLVSFPNISKLVIKRLIKVWGSGEEVIRVLAFLCLLRITTNQTTSLLDTVLKSMYMTYVINSKFVSRFTLPGINFMRRSLVEMFALDPDVSYRHVFVYIRQLAIHLSTAMKVKKRENIQAVYNWQYVNSLRLWADLLAATYTRPQLKRLVYPLIQICLGVLKLIPSSEYYPLRFHVVKLLIDFCKETDVYVPILPFILEVLKDYDFNKKHKTVSIKPLDFTCVLRLSNSQLVQNGFKDTTIDNVYTLLLEYLTYQSNSVAFPDLSLCCIFQIREFCKKCKNQDYVKKMRQIVEKINENNVFVERELKGQSFSLTDTAKIRALEEDMKSKGTPLGKFYESWNKATEIKRKRAATDCEKLGDYNIPKLIKRPRKERQDKKAFANPFEGDSDDSDGEINFGGKNEEDDEVEDEEQQVQESDGDDDGENIEDESDDDEKDNQIESNDNAESNDDSEGDEDDIVEDFYLSD